MGYVASDVVIVSRCLAICLLIAAACNLPFMIQNRFSLLVVNLWLTYSEKQQKT